MHIHGAKAAAWETLLCTNCHSSWPSASTPQIAPLQHQVELAENVLHFYLTIERKHEGLGTRRKTSPPRRLEEAGSSRFSDDVKDVANQFAIITAP